MSETYIKIIDIKDQEDGSAIFTLEMDDETRDLLIGFAVNSILKEAVQKMEGANEKGTCCGASCSNVGHKC
jgi:hypothetical protein